MAYTDDDYLPSPKELEVEDIKLSWIPFKSAARSMATYCDDECKEFQLCKDVTKDRRKCLEASKEVTKCANRFITLVKQHCSEEFTQYWRCIDRQKDIPAYRFCKPEQERFHSCLDKEMGVEIPPVGFFSKPRLHTPKHNYEEPKNPLGDLHGEQPLTKPDPKRIQELMESDDFVRTGSAGPPGAP